MAAVQSTFDLTPTPAVAVADQGLPMSPLREAALSSALPRHIALLGRRRADEVPADHLDDYIALGWLRWAAGRLIVTTRGSAVRDRMVAEAEAHSPI